jgi:transposase InsO family protein
VATAQGWLYLAVILDLFSRRVVGWKLDDRLEAGLVHQALQNALVLRQPRVGLYFHSDRGCQYTSQLVRKPLEVIQAIPSMSARGNRYENAEAEAFFSSLKTECFPVSNCFEYDFRVPRGLLQQPTSSQCVRISEPSSVRIPLSIRKKNHFFERKLQLLSVQKVGEAQASKRNKWKGPAPSAGSPRLCWLASLTAA